MRLYFKATYTGERYTHNINTAVFRLQNGTKFVIDCDRIESSAKDGLLTMVWKDCYLWAVNDSHLFSQPAYLSETDEVREFLSNLIFDHFEYDDDSDDEELSNVKFSV